MLPISKLWVATLVKIKNYFVELFFMSEDDLYCVFPIAKKSAIAPISFPLITQKR